MQRHHGNMQHAHLDQPALIGTRLARPAEPLWDVCCAPAASLPAPLAPAKRSRLADLDANVHCSVIGTCLTTAELRRLIPRHVPQLDRKHATDLQIHHTAVELSTSGGLAAKELTKALDTRHALTIKKFRPATDESALKQLWQEALASGDVPGAYWALMTHPASTVDLRALAFGDVHMLSHLVGASNRADLRRLGDLEEQCERLREHNAHLQARLHDMATHQAGIVEELRQQLRAQKMQIERQPATQEEVLAEVVQLRTALLERDQKLALHTTRRNEAEQRLLAEQQAHAVAREAGEQAEAAAKAAQGELGVLEQAFVLAMSGESHKAILPPLDGKVIVYVGGRPGTTAVLETMVAAAGGELLVHDGGIEDRRGLLAAMLPRAQLVVFPVDFISHNAMHVAKQTCARHGVPCHPIRSASVASFVELLQRLENSAKTN